MAHKVKCIWCNEQFDADIEPAYKINRRYGHVNCKPADDTNEYELAPRKDPPDPNFLLIRDFIQDKLGDSANWPLLIKTLQNMKEKNNYTYLGILNTLKYYYDIKKNKIIRNGFFLSIVPYWYKQSQEYYESLFKIEQQAEKLKEQKVEVKEITISIPKFQKKKKMFNLEDDE